MGAEQDLPCLETLPPVYSPLDRTKHEIRLLRILPSPDKATTIYCELETTTLDNAPGYFALSYEWNPPGVAESSARVLVNNQEVETTSNLRHALARLKNGPKYLYWVDALCINQSDKQERGHQVQFMRNIYQEAKQVIVWLGLGQGEMPLGMDFITEVANNELFLGEKEARTEWLLQELANPLRKSNWEGVIQILENTYWSRLWIVQEIVVASPLEIPLLCDSKSIHLEHLDILFHYIASIHDSQAINCGHELSQNIYRAWRIPVVAFHRTEWKSIHTFSPPYNVSLLQSLVRYCSQECQDPRDKVYALLGITTPLSSTEFPISYTIDASEVFSNVAKYIIEGSQRLDILLECHRVPDHLHSQQPSWVPNWELYEISDRTMYPNPRAWDASASLVAQGSFIVDGMVLRTRGFIIGKIRRKSKRFQRSESLLTAKSFKDWLSFVISTLKSPPVSEQNLRSWLRSLGSNLKSSRKLVEGTFEVDSPLGESVLEALFDALVRASVRGKYHEVACPFDKFRASCKKLVCDAEFPKESEWPFSGNYDRNPSEDLEERRLCSIKLSSHRQEGSTNDIIENSNVNSKQTVGLCPSYAKKGDFVAVLRGCKHPLILRKMVEGEGYQVINSVYVYGFMKGETVERFPEVDINLV